MNRRLQLVVHHRQRRHENDHVAERPDDDAAVARLENDFVADAHLDGIAAAGFFFFHQFNADHETPLANIADVIERRKLARQTFLDIADSRPHPFENFFRLEKLQARERRRAAEWVSGVRVPVEKAFELFVFAQKRRENLLGRERRREREIASGDSFRDTQDIWCYVRVVAGEHFPCAAEAGRDFVGDEENALSAADLPQRLQIRDRMRPHAGGALHERLDDQRSERIFFID
jgi:hypothetical protein